MAQINLSMGGQFLGFEMRDWTDRQTNKTKQLCRMAVLVGIDSHSVSVPDNMVDKVKELKKGSQIGMTITIGDYASKPGFFLRLAELHSAK